MPGARCVGRVSGGRSGMEARGQKLHLAVLQQFAGGGEFVLVAFHALASMRCEMSNSILPLSHGAAGDLFILGERGADLDAIADLWSAARVEGSGLAQIGEIFLPHCL